MLFIFEKSLVGLTNRRTEKGLTVSARMWVILDLLIGDSKFGISTIKGFVAVSERTVAYHLFVAVDIIAVIPRLASR